MEHVTMHWKKQGLNELIETYQSGMSWADMQKKYGISRGLITRALKKAGIPNRTNRESPSYAPELIDNVVDAYKANYSMEKVACKLNISVWKVRQILDMANVPVRKRGPQKKKGE